MRDGGRCAGGAARAARAGGAAQTGLGALPLGVRGAGHPPRRVSRAVATPTAERGPLSQLAHAIRLLLEFTDTCYEEKRYTCGEGEAALGRAGQLPPPTAPRPWCPERGIPLPSTREHALCRVLCGGGHPSSGAGFPLCHMAQPHPKHLTR